MPPLRITASDMPASINDNTNTAMNLYTRLKISTPCENVYGVLI